MLRAHGHACKARAHGIGVVLNPQLHPTPVPLSPSPSKDTGGEGHGVKGRRHKARGKEKNGAASKAQAKQACLHYVKCHTRNNAAVTGNNVRARCELIEMQARGHQKASRWLYSRRARGQVT